jgi:hypothetical protein
MYRRLSVPSLLRKCGGQTLESQAGAHPVVMLVRSESTVYILQCVIVRTSFHGIKPYTGLLLDTGSSKRMPESPRQDWHLHRPIGAYKIRWSRGLMFSKKTCSSCSLGSAASSSESLPPDVGVPG